MIRIAICEDKDEDLMHLHRLLCQTKIPCDIAQYPSAEALFFDMETGQKEFDLFFLDIFLPGQSGVDAARRIRAANEDAVLIFLSTSEDFYREAFDVYAFHYLIKPAKQEELTEVMQKAAKRIDLMEETLPIISHRQNVKLRQADIMYISSANHNLTFYMKDGKEYTSYGRLDDCEAQLNPKLFVRCHKSFIVNLLHVDRLSRDGFYVGDALLPISRSYAADAKERYHRRLFGIFQDK